MRDPLEGAKLKLEWADQHLELLKAESTAFYGAQPSPLTVEIEVEGGYHVLRHHVLRDPPWDVWSLLIGDAVHNARAALDHLAWQLAERHSPGRRPQPDRLTMFPIHGDEDGYNRYGARHLRWMDPRAAELINRLQPYKRADPTNHLLLLEELDIADKHKFLTLTTLFFEASPLRFRDAAGTEYAPVATGSAGPVEDGAELARFVFPEEPNVKVKANVKYQVGFGEGACRGKEATGTVHDVLVTVGRLIGIFERHVFHG